MKSVAPLLAALTLAVTLNGCMETLEVVGAIAEIAAEDEGYESTEEECDPAPASCRKYRPTTAPFHIQVSSPLPSTVTIYRGDFEEGRIVWSGSPSGNSFSVDLPFGTYSATATYARGGKTIIAVDGDYTDYSWDETCDGTCYDTVDGWADLELED
jgi:hypothetical protein